MPADGSYTSPKISIMGCFFFFLALTELEQEGQARPAKFSGEYSAAGIF